MTAAPATNNAAVAPLAAERARYDAGRSFSVQEAHRHVRDLFGHRVWIYWTDFLLSLAVGVTAFWAAGPLGLLSPAGLLCSLVAALALYRCFAFIHEIAHFRAKRALRGFRIGWNVLVGIPLLAPVFLYESHGEHHNKKLYGTERDAEYLPLARLSVRHSVVVVLGSFALPFFGPVRFGLLAPLGWLIPPLRRRVHRSLSTIKLDLEYQGRQPVGRRERASWAAQEAAAAVYVWAMAALAVSGAVPVSRLLQWYAVFSVLALANSLRILAAHRYLGNEEEMSVVEQMLDTVNYPRNRWLAELWAPVGLRLHALHHLMPGLPYHAYGAAHRRLVTALPADSAYRLTESPGMARSLRELWHSCRAHRRAGAILPLRPRTAPEAGGVR
ncbi:fatty acid desaturase family protein [Streptomyces bohaiensis]|uniref:Fatty acid desaturase n=1 Tax=Streptomyces bohaiensis TaxID=1431344 RepID=A0ABX1CDN2_9ACTN|nr:fatty acid desaturase [Streptomyces bohaiensis]NJQ14434.1 fatty acid desaturase [Streptomyces bohaiensis]